MKGNNKLELNEATLIEAVQEYLDKRMVSAAPKVTSVKAGDSGYSPTFMIQLEERTATQTGDSK